MWKLSQQEITSIAFILASLVLKHKNNYPDGKFKGRSMP